MNNITIDPRIEKVLYTHEQIVDACKDIAQWIDEKYKDSKHLVLVGLLKGSIPFLAELIKHIKVDHVLDFLTVSSYEGAMEQSTNIKIVMDVANDLQGKDVIIVEDIIDSGKTLFKVKQYLEEKSPKSLSIVTLLDKAEARAVKLKVDKAGFVVENYFLAGFGLDVKEKLRNIPYIGVFKKSEFDKL